MDGMSKKTIYRLNVLEMYVCHKLREKNVKADEQSFAYAEIGLMSQTASCGRLIRRRCSEKLSLGPVN